MSNQFDSHEASADWCGREMLDCLPTVGLHDLARIERVQRRFVLIHPRDDDPRRIDQFEQTRQSRPHIAGELKSLQTSVDLARKLVHRNVFKKTLLAAA